MIEEGINNKKMMINLKQIFILLIYIILVAISYSPFFILSDKINLTILSIFIFILGIICIKNKSYLYKFKKFENDYLYFSIIGTTIYYLSYCYNCINSFYIIYELVTYFLIGICLFFISKAIFKKVDNYYSKLSQSNFDKYKELVNKIAVDPKKYSNYTIVCRISIIVFILFGLYINFNTQIPSKVDDFWIYYLGCILLYFYIIVRMLKVNNETINK